MVYACCGISSRGHRWNSVLLASYNPRSTCSFFWSLPGVSLEAATSGMLCSRNMLPIAPAMTSCDDALVSSPSVFSTIIGMGGNGRLMMMHATDESTVCLVGSCMLRGYGRCAQEYERLFFSNRAWSVWFLCAHRGGATVSHSVRKQKLKRAAHSSRRRLHVHVNAMLDRMLLGSTRWLPRGRCLRGRSWRAVHV